MRVFFLVLFLISNTIVAFGQKTSVSGHLYDDDGEPIIGASIIVKGTSKGTVTDINGYYILNDVDIRDILVFQYIGMTTKEIPAGQLKAVKIKPAVKITEPNPSPELAALKDAPGVAFLTDKTPTYNDNRLDINYLSKFKLKGNNTYEFKYGKGSKPKGIQLQFKSSVGLETLARLPELQSAYSQGRTDGSQLQWHGPDEQEIFSWGPRISSLEYDGSNYAYDKNGRLTPSGTGQGKQANVYDATDFFGIGSNLKNELSAKFSGFYEDVIFLNLIQANRTGTISRSDFQSYNASAGIEDLLIAKNWRGDAWKGSATVSYNYSQGDLLNRGSNMATIMSSVLTTPATFDNSNGFSRKDAVKNSEAWRLNDGSMRSYSPVHSDNPFALANGLPDNENMYRLLASAGLKYKDDNDRKGFYGNAAINFEQQRNKYVNGTLPGSSVYSGQRYSGRENRLSDFRFGSNIFYRVFSYSYWDKGLVFNLSYNFNRQEERVSGSDVFSPSQTRFPVDNSLQRNTHEIQYGGKFSNRHFIVEASNRHYFSGTTTSSGYTNFFPYAGVRYNGNLDDLMDQTVQVEVFGNISRSLREAPLITHNPAVLSTVFKASEFKNYYEYADIGLPNGLNPETYSMAEVGASFSFMNNKMTVDFNYFNNTTSDFIVPVIQNNAPVLVNAAKVRNKGGSVAFTYSDHFGYHYDAKYWDIRCQISRAESKVKSLNLSQSYLPLAGFSDISAVLSEGKPVGALYGSTYLRNDKGEIITGNDGFPLVDNSMKMIGDPTPDFVVNLIPSINLKKFRFSFSMEYKHGGDKWNGTGAALDYYGMSKNTGDLRNTKGYVFQGVNLSGTANTQPVDFYNPALPLEQNRWVRYGFSGIGEEYIEDASYFRLSDISLAYTAIENNKNKLKIKKLRLIASAKNLFMFSPYKGVDPTSSLFGYATGSGLDLFNLPSIKSYNLSVVLEF